MLNMQQQMAQQMTRRGVPMQTAFERAQALAMQQQQQALQADWWQRMQQALMAGGSTDYMASWQNKSMPSANQYAQSMQTPNPWL